GTGSRTARSERPAQSSNQDSPAAVSRDSRGQEYPIFLNTRFFEWSRQKTAAHSFRRRPLRGDLREVAPHRQPGGDGGHGGDHRDHGDDADDAVPADGEAPEQRAEFGPRIGGPDIAGKQRDGDEEGDRRQPADDAAAKADEQEPPLEFPGDETVRGADEMQHVDNLAVAGHGATRREDDGEHGG